MDSRAWDRVTQSQRIKLIYRRVCPAGRIRLIHCQHNRLPGFQQHGCHFLIRCGHAGADVCDKNNHRCRINGDLSLLPHESEDLTVCVRLNAACIHHVECAPCPFARCVKPVSRNTRRIFNDRKPLPHKPVKQQRLAHIWPSYNCYQWSAHIITYPDKTSN